jgi:tetratricopeptide (TPR) repeat protein
LRGQVERKRGRYDAAATIYRQMLDRDGADAVARNNLANIEFARGDFASALSRYREGAAAGGPPEVVATSYYNLSLTHLQKFEYQPATEARSNADRLAGGRIDEYDRLWKYDSGDYAVVDLGLTEEQVWRKFEGRAGGTGVPNVAGTPARTRWVAVPLSSLGNRFAGFALAALLAIAALQRLRGPRAFTLHCQRCGTAFCRRCHLGSVVGGLCSQCYHLYVVRDGVSSPARNRKMTEVGQAEQRRRRIVRALSVLSPGAGHTFAGHPLFGTVYLMAWYGLLAAIFVPGRLASFTEAPSRLQPWWPLVVAVAGLVLVWGLANRFQPDFGLSVALRRPGARRGRAA